MRRVLGNKRVAVTGVSRQDTEHETNVVYKRLRERGYELQSIRTQTRSGRDVPREV
jgi:hypothetical protein